MNHQPDEPAFLDDEGPSEPPAHVCTLRLAEVLGGMTDDELAAWPGEIAERERERRRVRALPPAELEELRQDMSEASAWMRAELTRRQAAKLQAAGETAAHVPLPMDGI